MDIARVLNNDKDIEHIWYELKHFSPIQKRMQK